MPFDEINYPADRPSGVAAATNIATTVWLATYGSGWPGDEWGLQRVFATKEEAYAYAFRPERSKYEDCHIEEWALGGDCLSHVATSAVPRHEEATCCGARQVADVGEGWRDVRTGKDAEHLADGDWVQDADGFWEPISRFMWNGFGCPCKRYRRRVTPEAPQLSHSAVSAMCERNERAALLKKIDTLKAESTQQQEKILHAFLEAERLTAEVERLRGEMEKIKEAASPVAPFPKSYADAWRRRAYNLADEVQSLTAEVERLRLRPEEIACINEFADELSNNLPVTAMVVRDVIKRLGGGE